MKNLDASVKKNTAFIKKLREISDKQKDALLKELSGLKLDKFITEGKLIKKLIWNS